jgi:hypothetical protein
MLTVTSERPRLALHELEQTELAIKISSEWLTSLYSRREALIKEVDDFTRPPELGEPAPVKRVIPRGFEYRGKIYTKWSFIDIHVDLLKCLWTDYPERREAMAEAVSYFGNTRAYVARSPEALFQGRAASWARKHSRELMAGWYVDTNLNPERMRRIIPAAVQAAGLRWGQDVRTFWRRTELS